MFSMHLHRYGVSVLSLHIQLVVYEHGEGKESSAKQSSWRWYFGAESGGKSISLDFVKCLSYTQPFYLILKYVNPFYFTLKYTNPFYITLICTNPFYFTIIYTNPFYFTLIYTQSLFRAERI